MAFRRTGQRLGIQFLSPWCCLTIAVELIKWYLIRVFKPNKKNWNHFAHCSMHELLVCRGRARRLSTEAHSPDSGPGSCPPIGFSRMRRAFLWRHLRLLLYTLFRLSLMCPGSIPFSPPRPAPPGDQCANARAECISQTTLSSRTYSRSKASHYCVCILYIKRPQRGTTSLRVPS